MATKTASRYDEDLFKSSTMTFGEHLEELRTALFKSVIALVLGFLIGLGVGKYVVQFIQSPLQAALFKFYAERAVHAVGKEMAARKLAGLPIPPGLDNEKGIRELILEKQLLYDGAMYVDADLLMEQLRPQLGNKQPELESPEPRAPTPAIPSAGLRSGDKMLRIDVWRRAEEDPRLKLVTLGVEEGFMIYMKASFLAGALLASPAVFYFMWSFVAAGLYPHEKRYVHAFLPFSLGLFLVGAAMAFVVVFPPVLRFFFSFNEWLDATTQPRLSEWLGFVLLLPLGFGVSFQLPLIMLFLERIGIFTVQSYLSKWRIAVLVMAFAAMILSPGGDPIAMMYMLAPLIVLYFGGIALCRWMPSPAGAR